MDWSLTTDGPEVRTWQARTERGALLSVSLPHTGTGTFSWSVSRAGGWHVTGGYGANLYHAQRLAREAASFNGM